MTKFLRRTWSRYSKLGKKRKKKQVWRRPTGRDNKMREKRKGYPVVVSIGYKKNKKLNKNFAIVKNAEELEQIEKNTKIIIGHVGKKKRIEIIKKANEKQIEVANVNVKKFLKESEKKKKTEQQKPKQQEVKK